MKRLALVLVLILSACQTTGGSVGITRDQVGNVYPPECRGDLSHVVADIQFVSQKRLMMQRGADQYTMGWTYKVGNPRIVYIREDLTGWRRDDVIRHELCHIVAGDWHK